MADFLALDMKINCSYQIHNNLYLPHTWQPPRLPQVIPKTRIFMIGLLFDMGFSSSDKEIHSCLVKRIIEMNRNYAESMSKSDFPFAKV